MTEETWVGIAVMPAYFGLYWVFAAQWIARAFGPARRLRMLPWAIGVAVFTQFLPFALAIVPGRGVQDVLRIASAIEVIAAFGLTVYLALRFRAAT